MEFLSCLSDSKWYWFSNRRIGCFFAVCLSLMVVCCVCGCQGEIIVGSLLVIRFGSSVEKREG